MRKVRPALLASLSSLVLTLLAAPVRAVGGVPDALTPRGQSVQELINIVGLLGILVFLIVFAWLVIVIWRFREGSGHGRATHEKERHSLGAELTWTFIPLVMVLWIGYAAYGGLVELDHGVAFDPDDPDHVDILVTGSQWDWAADYGNAAGEHAVKGKVPTDQVIIHSSPDMAHGGHVADENVFYIPADTPVRFVITSTDVIHAWQVIDANRAFVMFVDANPMGANEFNEQVVSLPEGEYFVQCNKMCLNPGHAYMHARIQVVPQGQYDTWLAHQRALIRPAGFVVAEKDVTVTTDGFVLGNFTVPSKTHLVLSVTNPTDTAVAFALDGTAAPTTVPAASNGQPGHGYVTFDIADAGTHALASPGHGQVTITAVDAVGITVDLGEYRLAPGHLDLKVGTTYLITVENVHNLPHNLYIGQPGQDLAELPHSATLLGGGTDGFLYAPTETGEFVMWCNVPGHLDQGMSGTVTVT